MFKKLKQYIAMLLALILSVLSPIGGVSGLLTGSLAFAQEESELKTYLIPIKVFGGNTWDNYNTETAKSVDNSSNERPQIKDYALVNENSDGSCTVRLEYASYSLYDMVQVLNTEKIAGLKETYGSLTKVPFGNYNAPASTQDYKNPEISQFDIDRNYITQTVNENYNNEAKTGLADRSMDVGYVEIKVKDLSNDIPIKWYASATRQKDVDYWSFTDGMFVRLNADKKILLPKDKSLEDGVKAAGYKWTNYSEKKSNKIYNGERNISTSALNTLNSLFKDEVKIEKNSDGSLKAVFSLKDLNPEDPVTSIKIAKKRNLTENIYKKRKFSNWAMSEYRYAEWEELFAANTQTIELDFKDLTDAKLFQISTKSKDEKNAALADDKKTYFYGTLWLTKEIASEATDVSLQNTGEVDARLISTSDVIPEDAIFTLSKSTEVTKSKYESTTQAVISYAKDSDSHVIYDFSIKDKNGTEIIPSKQIGVEIALPEFYKDAGGQMIYYADSSYDGWGLPESNGKSIGEVISRDGKDYLKITPADLAHQIFSIAFIDAGTPMSEEDIAALEPGYYRVNTNFTITLLSGPSMANPVIDNSMGAVLHVKEKSGAYDIYMRFKSMKITKHAYVTGFKMYKGSLGKGSEPATVYKYTSLADTVPESWGDYGFPDGLPADAEDRLIFEELSKKYHIHYQNIVSMPLENRYNPRMKGWYVGVLSPLMNEATGSPMDEEKQTILRLNKETLKKVDDNYLGKYHPSVLKAQIDKAEWYLETIEGDAKTLLSAAIDKARAEYISQKQQLDETGLLKAVEDLKQAIIKAGYKEPGGKSLADGSYEIAYAMYKGEITDENVVSDYAEKFDKAYLTVDGDKMSLELSLKSEYASSITAMFYENGSTPTRADCVEKDGKVFYVINKKYTEKPFELGIKQAGEGFPDMVRIALDFSSAKPKTDDPKPDNPKPDNPKPDNPKPDEGYSGAFLELDNLIKSQEGKLGGSYEESSYRAYQSAAAAAKDLLQNYKIYKADEEAAKKVISSLEKEFAALIGEDQLKGGTAKNAALDVDFGYFPDYESYERATDSDADPDELPGNLNKFLAGRGVEVSDHGSLWLSDGEYTLDYALWQFAENKASMGNPAMGDVLENKAGKQTKLAVSNGRAYLQLDFHQMSFKLAGVMRTGHLLDMVIMDNLVSNDGVVESFDLLAPVNAQYSDETDGYGPPEGRKYPSSLVFDITKWVQEKQEYIPVQVNVPAMEASAVQPARIRLYWGTLSDKEGKSIKKPGEKPETGIANSQEYKDLQSAVKELFFDLSDKGYTDAGQRAFTDSYRAGEKLLEYGKDTSLKVTADMLTKRREAMLYTKAARIPSGNHPSPGTPEDNKRPGNFTPLKEAMKNVLSILQSQVNYTQESLDLLSFEYNQAASMLKEGTATKAEIMAEVDALRAAVKNLKVREQKQNQAPNRNDNGDNKQKNPNGNDQKNNNKDNEKDSNTKRKDGYYTVSVALWHASMNKASMGNPALSKTAYVHISGDTATMRLVTKRMTFSGITTHLYDFYTYNGSDYENAKLVSTEKDQWIYEFDLTNTKSGYYKVKVDPRVDVMGTDPVKARLKVSWGSMKKTTDEKWDKLTEEVDESKDDEKSGKSASGTKTGELVDAATGIRASGALGGPDVRLNVLRTESELANKALEGKVTQFQLYDIKLKSGNSTVQPGGSVLLRFPLPTGYAKEKLALYYIPEQGEAVLIGGSVKDGFFEANVDHFSLYALVESTQVQNSETKAQEVKASAAGTSSGGNVRFVAANTSGSSGKSATFVGNEKSEVKEGAAHSNKASDGRQIPYTGDKMPVSALFFMLAISLASAGSTWLKKRREH